MVMKWKCGDLGFNTKLEVMHLCEVSGSAKIDIGRSYGLTSFSIVHHYEEQ
jgi:hypothetical protein